MRQRVCSLIGLVLLVCGRTFAADSQEIRPGVWAAQQPETLPTPKQRFEVYLVGEIHGVQENVEFQLKYLEQLHRLSGLRDIAIEERSVYEMMLRLTWMVDQMRRQLVRSLMMRSGTIAN